MSEKAKGMVVEVEAELKKPACPCCDSTKLYRHGRAEKRKILHGWSQGKKAYLEIARHRWRCQNCWYSFSEGVEFVRLYSRLTRQAEVEALWQLKDGSFSRVSKEPEISYNTLRRPLESETDEKTPAFMKEEDEIFLRIDEHALGARIWYIP